jgi:hypothetical protein
MSQRDLPMEKLFNKMNFQLGKKNRSTDAVESLSKKHLDGNVEQHAQTFFIVNNVNGEHSAADFQKTGKNSGKYFYYLCKFLQTLIYEEGKMHRVINFHVFQIQSNLVDKLPMGHGLSTKNLKIFHQVLAEH